MINKIEKKAYFDAAAPTRQHWLRKGWYYHADLARYLNQVIPAHASVLQIGCGTGHLLAALNGTRKIGVDISEAMVERARTSFSGIEFHVDDIDDLRTAGTFDYIILVNVIGYAEDVQTAMQGLRRICTPATRVVIVYFNYFWEPVLRMAEFLRLRMRRPRQHWLSCGDISNLLYLNGFEVVKKDDVFLFPLYLPLVAYFINHVLARLPLFHRCALNSVIIAKTEGRRQTSPDASVSVIIPCRNEKGNIEEAVRRLPDLGADTEVIFVEGHSRDGTLEECYRVQNLYAGKNIRVIEQNGIGKGDAVRAGFRQARGDILIILDADLTVPPEDMPKFRDALVRGKGELIIGTRLVYQMEKQAMRFLNLIGNKFFSSAFTFLLGQHIKDTLCGTKALWRQDYESIARNRSVFGDFDPFGDFDLIFGAAKLNLKITQIPVRYRQRTYGETQISRFKHGWLLLRMTFIAVRKLKFV